MRPALLLALVALGPHSAAAAESDPARVSLDVVPTFEALRLDLDSAKKTYSGTARFDLEVKVRTGAFRLHARDMTLTRVVLKQGGTTIPTTTREGEIGLLMIRAASRLATGAATLEVDFTN